MARSKRVKLHHTVRRKRNAAAFGAAVLAGLGATSGATSSTTLTPPAVVSVAQVQAPSSYPATNPCPIQGDARGDPLLNDQKNRYIPPSPTNVNTQVITAGDLIDLSAPQELQSLKRDVWPSDNAVAQVEALETTAATVVGYLIDVKQENTGKGESSNCHEPKRLFDYHIYIADKPSVAKAETAVVEMTPRWRSVNKSWDYHAILAMKNKQVRVSGWLLFDEEHLDQVGEYRATVWEIHPVTGFEFQQNGTWKAL